jgi:hypothetical protein
MELFQIIINPPEAPLEGTNTYSSKLLGQQDLIKAILKSYFLVSCKQTTEQPLILIAFIRANCLVLALIPLIFQHNANHFLRKFITKAIKQIA